MTETDSTTPGVLRRRVLHPATLISLGAAILLLVVLIRGSGISLSEMLGAVREADPLLVLAALLAYYINFPLRGLRWRLLVRNAQEASFGLKTNPLPGTRAFSEIIFLGWFVNAISWFRMGDPYRAYLVSRQRDGESYPMVLGTVLAERVVDAVTFAALVLAIGALIWTDASGPAGAIIGLAVLVGAGSIGAILVMALIGGRAPAWMPARVRDWVERLRTGALLSLEGRLGAVAALSIGGWAAEGVRLLLVTMALGLDVPLPVIAFVALAHNLITALPLTPGGLGVAEAGMVGLLLPWMPLEDAAVLTALDRSISWLSVIIFGAILMAWREGIRQGRY